MTALCDNLTCSLMRGSSSPLAENFFSTSFSMTFSLEPSMLYNVKRAKGLVYARVAKQSGQSSHCLRTDKSLGTAVRWLPMKDVSGEEGDEESATVQSRSDHTTTPGRVILELSDEEDRITGALQIGLVGCRRSASWICFGGGARPRRKRAWKTTIRKGSFAKARKLVDAVSQVTSSKDEIYGALDAFVAWELEFPIVAIKKALQFLAEAEQWKRVIQVTKWMLSKGQGRTLGTYTLLLEALDYEGRVEEADALWEKLLTEHEEATPRIMFTTVIAMFERHEQPRRLLQVFADMEELEIKPDAVTVERVAKTYRSLGLMKRAEAVELKYPPTKWAWRYGKRGRKFRIRVTADGEIIEREKSSQPESEAEDEDEDEGEEDSDNGEFIYEEEEEAVAENRSLLNPENGLPTLK